MPEEHLTEYQLFYQEQPFGLWREDYRAAQIAYLLAVVNSDPKKSPPTLTEFMPFFAQEEEETEEDDGVVDFLARRQ